MTVNIVVKPGWILERMARELAARLSGVTVNAGEPGRAVATRADLHYYLPARDYQKFPCRGRALGFYTHGDTGVDLVSHFASVGAMNLQMAARLRAAGASDVAVIRPGVDVPPRPIVFGVIGRVYNNGRKGEDLVRQAVRAGFTFVACRAEVRGRSMTKRQWPCPSPYTIDQRHEFYRAIDYLVVTSTDEGGPMPVLEAIAHGVPVIAPLGVGWCDEFECLGRYEPGQWEALRAVLDRLTRVPTWAQWAEEHRRWFTRLEARAA